MIRSSLLFLIAMCVTLPLIGGETRTWTDTTGKFKIEAEFVSSDGKQVTFRKTTGETLAVPLAKLSKADQDFIAGLSKGVSLDGVDTIVSKFYEDLRTTERTAAAGLMTEAARKHVTAGTSSLSKLPTPDEGDKSVKIGAPKAEGSTAAVPVRVKSDGKFHKTKLHLRREGEAWAVFAISAEVAGNEMTIDFESAPADPNVDPLLALVGKPVELVGMTMDNQPLDWAAYKGKVVLIDFWATWCGPCRAEMPNVRANYDEFHEKGFDVIAVSVDDNMDDLKAFMQEENPPWVVVADSHPKTKAPMAAKFGISGIPAFILVDAEGNVAAVNCRGPRLREELGKLIK